MPTDSAPDLKASLDPADIENHPANKFFVNLQNALADKLQEENLPKRSNEIAKINEDGCLEYSFYIYRLDYTQFIWSPGEMILTVYIVIRNARWKEADAEQMILNGRRLCNIDFKGATTCYYFKKQMTPCNLGDPANLAQVANEAADLYKAVYEVQLPHDGGRKRSQSASGAEERTRYAPKGLTTFIEIIFYLAILLICIVVTIIRYHIERYRINRIKSEYDKQLLLEDLKNRLGNWKSMSREIEKKAYKAYNVGCLISFVMLILIPFIISIIADIL